MTAALMLPLILTFAGAAIDYQRWGSQRTRLQEFSDLLALRGAKELILANSTASGVESVVRSIANGSLPGDLHLAPFALNVEVDRADATVTVDLTQPAGGAILLSHFSPFNDDIQVGSTAVARGGMNVCVIALQEAGAAGISTDDEARLDASNCAIISNSTSRSGIHAARSSLIKGDLICSAGGASGSSENFNPAPTTDCPAYSDPLSERAPPPVGPCDHVNFEFTQRDRPRGSRERPPPTPITLSPGVYCGGLRIGNNIEAAFSPGVYVIKDGPLDIGKHSTLSGRNVGFYLIGDASVFTFDKEAKITMSAPEDGPMAGIMFFEDRNAPLDRVHSILSDDAREFLGTFYLPRGVLRVQTQKPVADASAYTAVVARRLELSGRPTLRLNTNYADTTIPAPEGVGPVGGQVYLRD